MSQDATAAFFANNVTFARDIVPKKRFDGKKVSEYLELFEEKVGFYDFADEELKISTWFQWCKKEPKDVGKGLLRSLKAQHKCTWEEFSRALKLVYKAKDPEQTDTASTALKKFYGKRIPHQKMKIVDAMITHSALLARQPSADRDNANKLAVKNFYKKLHIETRHMILNFMHKLKEELYIMDWSKFSEELTKLVVEWFDEVDTSDSSGSASSDEEISTKKRKPKKNLKIVELDSSAESSDDEPVVTKKVTTKVTTTADPVAVLDEKAIDNLAA
ncbi:hypothetical protein N0V85_009652, partial [Neurospora sp. IMI 360204]